MEPRHPASDKKLRRLRQQGDVVPVGDLPIAGLALAGVVAWWGVGPRLLGCLARVMQRLLADPGPAGLQAARGEVGAALAWTLVAAALLVAGATLPAWIASGFLVAPARLMPGLTPRLEPRPRAAARHLAVAGLTLVLLLVLAPRARALARASSPGGAARAAARCLQLAGGVGVAVAVLGGLVAHLRERWRYQERVAMSDEERRRESQEDQGSPALRRARDQLAERLLAVGAPTSGGGAAAGMTDVARPWGGAGPGSG